MNTQTKSADGNNEEKTPQRQRLCWLLAMAFIYGLAGALATQFLGSLPLSFLDREVARFWSELYSPYPPLLQQIISLLVSFGFWAFCLIFLLRYVSAQKILLFGFWLILLSPMSNSLLEVISFSMLTYLCMAWSNKRRIALNLGLVLGTYYFTNSIFYLFNYSNNSSTLLSFRQVSSVLEQNVKITMVAGAIIIAFLFTLLAKMRPDTVGIPAQKFRPIFRKRYMAFYLILFFLPIRTAAYTSFYSGVVPQPTGLETFGYWFYFDLTLFSLFLAYPIYGFLISKFGERRILVWEAIASMLCTAAGFTAIAPITLLLFIMLPFSTLAVIASLSHLKKIVLPDELAGTTLLMKTLMVVFNLFGITLAINTMESQNTIGLVTFYVVIMAIWLAFVWRLPEEKNQITNS